MITKTVGYNEFTNFLDTFGLQNLITDKTCYFNEHASSIDVILTSRPRKFYLSKTFELGVSDCHKMIITSLRAHVSRIKNKNVHFRSFKNFNKHQFLKKLTEEM